MAKRDVESVREEVIERMIRNPKKYGYEEWEDEYLEEAEPDEDTPHYYEAETNEFFIDDNKIDRWRENFGYPEFEEILTLRGEDLSDAEVYSIARNEKIDIDEPKKTKRKGDRLM